MIRVLEVRDHRKVDQPHSVCRDQDPVDVALRRGERDLFRLDDLAAPLGWIDVGLAERGGGGNASGAHPDIDRVWQRRQKLRQSRLLQPVRQVQGIAAPNKQRVGLPDRWDPGFVIDARQRGQLQHSHRLPTQSRQWTAGFSGDRPVAHPGAARKWIDRGGNEEGVRILDRFAKQDRPERSGCWRS